MTLRRALVAVAALLAALAAVLAFNTLRHGSRQLVVEPLPALAIDRDGAAQSLAAAVRAKTVSGLLDAQASAQGFAQLHEHLRQRYPRVHAQLALERVGDASSPTHTLVFRWRGQDPSLKPIALLAHQDVVPVAPGTESLWTHPPFEGRVDGGFVWGRGTGDNKGNLVAQLEAAELLLASGFTPRRTVLFVFGHDEEVGGRNGAAQVVAHLQQRGERLEAALDEGLLVTEGVMPGVAAPVALVGLAEKGYASFEISASAKPGHSSMPPGAGDSAVGMLSAALARLDARPMPGGVSGVAEQMFATVGPEMTGAQRVVLSNLWLTRPLVERMLSRTPSTNAMLRSTVALTMLNAGNKDNVLPGEARAVVNTRVLPGDTLEGVVAHLKAALADERITVKPIGIQVPASRVSRAELPFFGQVNRAIREVFPGTVVTPGLMLAGSDVRHFEAVADDCYRFMPVRAKPEDLARFHGTDERLSIDNLAEMIRFYHRLLQLSAGA